MSKRVKCPCGNILDWNGSDPAIHCEACGITLKAKPQAVAVGATKTFTRNPGSSVLPALSQKPALDLAAETLAPGPKRTSSSDRPTISPHGPANHAAKESTLDDLDKHPPETEVVRVVGYEILGELGRGGMGVVYRARQLALRRLVALKMILSGVHAGEAEIARFRSEAKLLAKLQHPNIVQIHDVGEQAGRPFFSMELLEGGSLNDQFKGVPQPPRKTARLIEKLARAMHACHLRGIVHRDLKPSNILLNEEGEPKITDFSLAKAIGERDGLTQTGAVMGTPSFMSPEQAAGRTRDIGPPADIYALGAIMYAMLTGRPPFRADTDMDTMMKVVTEEPLPPTRFEAKVPPDLETICLKCLDKEMSHRYPTADELADDLNRYLNNEPIKARPISWLGRVQKWARRRPAIAALSTMLVLSMTLGVSLVTWQWRVAEQKRAQAEAAEKKAAERADSEAAAKQRESQLRTQAEDAKSELQAALRKSQLNLAVHRITLAERELGEGRILLGERLLADIPWNFRSLEWNYVAQRNCSRPFPQLKVPVFTPDGTRFIAASNLGVVQIDIASGRALASALPNSSVKRILLDHAGERCGFWVTRDDSLVIVKCRDFVGEGTLKSKVKGCYAFHPDGKHVIRVSEEKIALVEIGSWKETELMTGLPQAIYASISADGKWLVANNSAVVVVWNLEDKKEVWRVEGIDHMQSVGLSPDSSQVAYPGKNHTILLADIATGKELRSLEGHVGYVQSTRYSPDGKRLVSTGWDSTVRTWDLTAGKLDRSFYNFSFGVFDAVFNHDATKILASDMNATSLLDLDPPPHVHDFAGHQFLVLALAMDPTNQWIASIGIDSSINVFDARTRERLKVIDCKALTPHSIFFNADGTRIGALTNKSTIQFWSVPEGEPVQTIQVQKTGNTRYGCANRDGSRLIVPTDSNFVLLSLPDGKSMWTWEGPSVLSACFSADEGRILTFHNDGKLRLFDALCGEVLANANVGVNKDQVGVVLSADCNTAFVPFGNDIRRVNLVTGEMLAPLRGHTSKVQPLLLSPDGKRLISGGWDNTIRFWDIETAQETFCLFAQIKSVNTMKLSTDGTQLAAAGLESAFRVWNLGKPQPWGTKIEHGVVSLALAPENNNAWTITTDGNFACVDLTSGEIVRFHPLLESHASQIALAPGSDRAVSCKGNIMRVFDTHSRKEVFAPLCPTVVTAVGFLDKGYRIAAVTGDRNIRVWNMDSKEPDHLIRIQGLGVIRYATQPEGDLLAYHAGQGTHIIDSSTGKHRTVLPTARNVLCLAFNRDGTLLGVGTSEGTIEIWDIASRKKQATVPGFKSPVTYLAFGPDNASIAFTSTDRAIRVWNWQTKQTLFEFIENNEPRFPVFSPDGKFLLWSNSDQVRMMSLTASKSSPSADE